MRARGFCGSSHVKITAVLAAGKGAETQAISVTKGGRNRKMHAVVDEGCRPWLFVLTRRNTADCTAAETCVSLIPGIAGLVADKGHGTDAFRAWLKERQIKVIPGKSTLEQAWHKQNTSARSQRHQAREAPSSCSGAAPPRE